MLNKNIINDVDFLRDVYVRVMICTYNKNENVKNINDCFNEFYENVIKEQITFNDENDVYSFFAMLYVSNCVENDVKLHFHIVNYLSLKIANNEHSFDECVKRIQKMKLNCFDCCDFDDVCWDCEHFDIFN